MNDYIELKETTKRRLKLPEDLQAIIEKSNSFEEDVHLLALWFDVGTRRKKLEAIIKSVIDMEKISWPNIKKELENQGIVFNITDQNIIILKIRQKLKTTKNKTTAIMFFRIIKKLQGD